MAKLSNEVREEIEHLAVAEKIVLVEEIWDSVARQQESVEVTPAQKEELDRRLVSFEQSKDAGDSWQAVKTRTRKRE